MPQVEEFTTVAGRRVVLKFDLSTGDVVNVLERARSAGVLFRLEFDGFSMILTKPEIEMIRGALAKGKGQ